MSRRSNFRFRPLTRLEDRIAPATQLLPDITVLSSYLSGWSLNNTTGGGRELRFSTGIANGGAGAFELNGTTTYFTNPDGTQSQVVNQKIFWDDASTTARQAGTFTYHPQHGHVHFDDMAVARLRTRSGTTVGPVVASGPKTSFCLLDTNRINGSLPGSPTTSKYNQCNSQTQGISVGWADVYGSTLEGQSIDVTGIPNGDYWLEVEFDPENHILESDEANNATRIAITITTQPTYYFRVIDVSPAGANDNATGAVTFTFNQVVNPSTFTADDVTFTGPSGAIPVTSITTADNLTFSVNFAQQTKVGTYQMNIGPNINSATGSLLDQTNNGIGGEPADAYINIFTITPPQVLSTSPAGGVSGPLSSLRVTFNKPMLSSSFTPADVFDFSGPGGSLLGTVTSVTPLSVGGISSVFDIAFAPISATGPYSLTLGTDITDAIGNTMDQNGDQQTNAADRYTANFAVTPAGYAGPDAFGYSARVTTPPSTTIVGKAGVFTIHTNADDANKSVNFGTLAFNFYGTTYTGNAALYVSTNGLITFTAGNSAWTNDDLTSLTTPAIAALWDDWYLTTTASPQVLGLFEDTTGDGKADRLIIEWNQQKHANATTGNTGVSFQTVLELNTGARPGNIIYNYLDLATGNTTFDNGASATVGWRGVTGGPRLVVSQDSGSNPLVATGKAILVSVPRVQSITRLDPNPNNEGAVEFEVTFSESVTNVGVEAFTVTTTGTVGGAMIDHIHTTADPAVFEIHVKGYTGSGTLRLDVADTDTISSGFGAKLGGVGAGNGSFTAGEAYTIVQAPPIVFGTVVGDGTAQRSRVGEVQVIFDKVITFAGTPTAAFTLTNALGQAVPFDVTLLAGPAQTTAKITPLGGGSFADGRFTLTALSSQLSTGGVQLDGDANGSAGGNFSMQFHRLFGDADGDATVSSSDFLAFRVAFLSANTAFDSDGDGVVGASDFLAFRLRYLMTV